MGNGAIVALALLGLAIASDFTAVAWRWMKPDARWLPPVCRMGADSCAAIVFTPRARLFGAPNSLLGQIYYLALLAGVATGRIGQSPWHLVFLAAATLTVLTGAYLTYSLLFVTRVRCPLCLTSHLLNLLILLLLLV